MGDVIAEQLDALVAEHGPVAHMVYRGELYAFRKPTLAECDEFLDAGPKKGHDVAALQLVQQTAVTDIDAVRALCKAKSLAAPKLASGIAELAGHAVDVRAEDDVAVLEYEGVRLAFRMPTRKQWEEHTDAKKGKIGVEARRFAVSLATDPAAATSFLDQYPLAVKPLEDALADVSGADLELTTKKG